MKKRCFFEKIHRSIRSEKGAAAVLTLSVVLVLAALGTISILASVLNVRMSGKAMDWSEEFYALDSAAESKVNKIDDILIEVERDARDYVLQRLERVDTVTGLLTNTYDMDTSGAQDFFHEYYKQDWTYLYAPGTLKEYTMGDYEAHYYLGDLDTISKAYEANNGLTATEAYLEDLKTYVSGLFDRVYFHMLSRKLEELHASATEDDFRDEIIVIKGAGADYGIKENTQSDRCTWKFYKIEDSLYAMTLDQIWEYIKPEDDSVGLLICIEGGTANDRKQVHVDINIPRPDYEAVLQSITTPILGNPIWANALSVSGGITIVEGANATILGDVYASGNGGIAVREGANGKIRGNVYTAGDVRIAKSNVADGGNLRIYTKDTDTDTTAVSYDHKRLIYENSYLHDGQYNALITNFANYASGSAVDNMPFIFKDAEDIGNVYCSSLLVEEGVKGADLKVDGNLWTSDDIQMDGESSALSIGTVEGPAGNRMPKYNYIGLNSDSTETDPNASSSVINNFPFNGTHDNSTITINSNFIVPGVAFYNFYVPPALVVDDFYKSVESMTSRTSNPVSIISGYRYTGGGGGHREYTNADDEIFDLITEGSLEKREALVDFIYNSGGVFTNVLTDLTAPDGYVAGVALLQPNQPAGDPAKVYTHNPNPLQGAESLPNASLNWTAYSNLMNSSNGFALFNIFAAKTRKLGIYDLTDPYAGFAMPGARPFSNFVDASVPTANSEVIRLAGGTLNIDTTNSGIVYCSGNLTVTGSPGSEFKGTIICNGNLTIQNNVRIVYDESVIYQKLEKSANVRRFFKKGQMGEKLGDIEEYSTTSGHRQAKRYRVIAWKEVSVYSAP